MSFLSWLQGFGNPPSDYRQFVPWGETLKNNLGNYLVQVRRVAGGTASADFDLQWTNYGFAVPDVAIVVEGDNHWHTYDNGANWSPATAADAEQTGHMRISLDTTLKTGYLWCDSSAQLIASYSDLNDYLIANLADDELRRWITQATWTSTSEATFDLRRPMDGMANADIIDLYWNSGTASRLGMDADTVTTSSFGLSGGVGDAIPNDVGSDFQFQFGSTKFLLPDYRELLLMGASAFGGGTDVAQNALFGVDAILSPAGKGNKTPSFLGGISVQIRA